MDLLIKNATIIPMTEKGYSFNGSIGIENGTIVSIGTTESSVKADTVIDAKGMIALPGLINSHTHLSMTFFRNWQDNVAHLHDWLTKIWPIEEKLVYDDVLTGSLLGIAESIMAGTTCFSDMYFFAPATCEAVLATGIKANIGLTMFGDLRSSEARIADNWLLLEDYKKRSDRRITIDIAPHALYTCSGETYRYASKFAADNGCRLHTHASETKKEVDDCKAVHGCSPIEYLDRLNCLGATTYLAHCVHVDDHDMDLIAKRGSHVIHNPSSNCKLASGAAPITRLLDRKVSVALGTDGASSNNSLDIFQEMRLAKMLSSLRESNPQSMEPYDILYMATVGGAEALGRLDECGTLEIGKDADIILIDTDTPHLTPLNDPFSAMVFAATSSDVDTTICRGKVLMRHRKLLTIDTKKAIDSAIAHWSDITERP